MKFSTKIQSSLIILLLIFSNCQPQTNEGKIYAAGQEVIKAIGKGDSEKFKSMLGVELRTIGKNDEMISYDVKQYKLLFEKYLFPQKPHLIITNLYNNLGQRLVKIPIYDYAIDTLTEKKRLFLPRVNELHLNIYFGPPNIIPLNQISGYALIQNNADSNEFKTLIN